MKRPAQWIAAFFAAGGLLPARHLLAQGCSMCYSDAAAQSAAGIRALQHGIVVLLVPSLAVFIAIFAVAYRRRGRFNDGSAFEGAPRGASTHVNAGRTTEKQN